ncbi:thiol-disulfide oxidoreductase ResA [Paenibacillus sp. y28]|uniref:thiol-disulfide oxidoreductase ResA n=1 Tax=Paenibacillus sp. y28 TaxID=3129110 RepID=UPI00301AEA7D
MITAAGWKKAAAILIFVLLAVAAVYAVLGSSASGERVRLGAKAPDFTVTNLEGQAVRLSDYRGQGVVLNFWGSWCEPCVKEMPLLNEVYGSGHGGVEIVGVNVGETKGTVKQFADQYSLAFPVFTDPAGEAAGAYQVRSLPTTFVIDKSGKIVEIINGELSDIGKVQDIVDRIQP